MQQQPNQFAQLIHTLLENAGASSIDAGRVDFAGRLLSAVFEEAEQIIDRFDYESTANEIERECLVVYSDSESLLVDFENLTRTREIVHEAAKRANNNEKETITGNSPEAGQAMAGAAASDNSCSIRDLSFHEKLIWVTDNLNCPKGQYNTHGKFAYRNAEDIFSALKPLLSAVGLRQSVHDEIKLVGDRYFVEATITVTDGKEKETATASAREPETAKGMSASQLTGTASSYARKYALNGMWGIDDVKDPDADEFKNAGINATRENLNGRFDGGQKQRGPRSPMSGVRQAQQQYNEVVGNYSDEFSQYEQAMAHEGNQMPAQMQQMPPAMPASTNPKLVEVQFKRDVTSIQDLAVLTTAFGNAWMRTKGNAAIQNEIRFAYMAQKKQLESAQYSQPMPEYTQMSKAEALELAISEAGDKEAYFALAAQLPSAMNAREITESEYQALNRRMDDLFKMLNSL